MADCLVASSWKAPASPRPRDDVAAVMRASPWLGQRPERMRDGFLALCQRRRLRRNEVACHAGDACEGLYFLAQGMVKLELPTPGHEFRTVSVKQEGFWFGADALLRGSRHVFTVTCATDVVLGFVGRADFEKLAADSSWCRAFADLALAQYDESLALVSHFLLDEPERRILARLVLLAQSSMAATPNVLRVTQHELAEMCALSRPTAQQALSRLEAQGLVKCGYRRIELAQGIDAAWLAHTGAGVEA